MVDFSFERSGDIGILKLDGELDPDCFDDLMAALMTSIGNSEHLVIDLGQVKEFDPPCLRLLCVACRTSSRLQKRFTLTGKKTVCSGGTPDRAGSGPVACSLTIN